MKSHLLLSIDDKEKSKKGVYQTERMIFQSLLKVVDISYLAADYCLSVWRDKLIGLLYFIKNKTVVCFVLFFGVRILVYREDLQFHQVNAQFNDFTSSFEPVLLVVGIR